MMRTLFFSAVLMFGFCFIHSQNKDKEDSIRFYAVYQKAYNTRNTKPDSALLLLDKAMEAAVLSANKEWMAKVFNLRGIVYYRKNDYLKSLTELEKAMKHTTNEEMKGKININMGNTLSDMGYSYSAIQYYKEAIRIFDRSGNNQFLVRALMNLASEEFNVGQILNARNHLKLALFYAREYQMMEEEAMCLNNLSAMYIKSGLVDSASRYIYQSFNAYEQTENYFGLADAYLTAIELHLEKKEWSYAKALMDLADSLIDKLQYLEGKKLITSEKVNYYLHINDCTTAAVFFNEYLRLEDSLVKKKYHPGVVPSVQQNISEDKRKIISSNYISYIQLFFITGMFVYILVFVFKNYRYGKA